MRGTVSRTGALAIVGGTPEFSLWHDLMRTLGYDRYFAHGGLSSATWPGTPPLNAEKTEFQQRAAALVSEEGGYSVLQTTKPQTLSWALADSLIGLAVWISEKFEIWTDSDGNLEDPISMDRLLTKICVYWFGNSIDASATISRQRLVR